jgi:hypothetical protein
LLRLLPQSLFQLLSPSLRSTTRKSVDTDTDSVLSEASSEVLPRALVISPPTLCKLSSCRCHQDRTNIIYSGGLAEGIQGTGEVLFDTTKGIVHGAVDTTKGLLSGVADTLGGVLGIGGDLLEAITGIRPWRQTDIDQLNEIRTAIRPVVKRYAH